MSRAPPRDEGLPASGEPPPREPAEGEVAFDELPPGTAGDPGDPAAAGPAPGLPAQAASPLHTKFSRGLVLLALGTGALAMALGNLVLLLLAATVAAMLHAARTGWPGTGSIALQLSASRVQRGRTLGASLAVATQGAPSLYLAHAALPPSFSLERGSNVHLLEAGASASDAFLVGCPKRGPFTVPPATLTALHPHLLAPATVVATSAPCEVVVEPRVQPVRRARQLRTRARARLGDDRGLRGPGGADFREVREYQRGDPLKAVNWRATARRSTGELELMVNDFEPEARKNIWFFLDLSPRMEVGTSLDNALEDAVETTLALVHHFTTRGHRVGGTTFNGAPVVFYPDAGSRQHLTVARGLAHAEAGDGGEGLAAAVERVRGFLARERPTVFVVTRPDIDPEGLSQGARRILHYAAGSRPQPVVVLAPEPAARTSAEALGQALLGLEARGALGSPAMLRVVALHRGARSLAAALAKGVLAR